MTIIFMFYHTNFRFYHVGVTRPFYFFISLVDFRSIVLTLFRLWIVDPVCSSSSLPLSRLRVSGDLNIDPGVMGDIHDPLRLCAEATPHFVDNFSFCYISSTGL
jgi:hypothetical protein